MPFYCDSRIIYETIDAVRRFVYVVTVSLFLYITQTHIEHIRKEPG